APERSRTCSAPSSFASRPRGCGNPTRTTSRSRRRRRITGAEVLPLPEPRPEERPVLVVDLGGQYAQLIARRVREARVYSELVPHTITAQQVRARRPHALILSVGPASVYADGAPRMDADVLKLGVPMLGVCYGMQLLALELGGSVERTGASEFGKTELRAEDCGLFEGLPSAQTVWMSHRDSVVAPPAGARVVAGSPITGSCAKTRPSRWSRLSLITSMCRLLTSMRSSGSCRVSPASRIRSRSERSSARSSFASSRRKHGSSVTCGFSFKGRCTP